jgi:hypothetical protein
MNGTIVKEKNLYYFNIEGCKKPYILDVNTGKLFGQSGNPLMRVPDKISYLIYATDKEQGAKQNCLYYLISGIHSGYTLRNDLTLTGYADCFLLADRFMSVGLGTHPLLLNLHFWNRVRTMKDFYTDNFSIIVKWLLDNPTVTDYYYFWDVCGKAITRNNFIKKHNLRVDGHIVTDEMVDFLIGCLFTDEQVPYALYFLRKHSLLELEHAGINQHNLFYSNRIIDEYFKLCDYLNVPYEKEDLFKMLVSLKREYNLRKAEIDNERLRKNQLAKKAQLSFSNEYLEVIIPTTTEEFIAESKAQNNCVATHYLSAVVDNRTYIVFIREKKNPNRSYITCEVDKNGRIIQYLLACNQPVTDELDIQFAREYQAHLNSFFW